MENEDVGRGQTVDDFKFHFKEFSHASEHCPSFSRRCLSWLYRLEFRGSVNVSEEKLHLHFTDVQLEFCISFSDRCRQ